MREVVEEQRHKEKEDWLKRKADEKKAGIAPPPCKAGRTSHGGGPAPSTSRAEPANPEKAGKELLVSTF